MIDDENADASKKRAARARNRALLGPRIPRSDDADDLLPVLDLAADVAAQQVIAETQREIDEGAPRLDAPDDLADVLAALERDADIESVLADLDREIAEGAPRLEELLAHPTPEEVLALLRDLDDDT